MEESHRKFEISFFGHDVNLICRVCGLNADEELVPIFGCDGVKDLGSKIRKYLPIKIRQDDILPTQVCAPCVNTVLGWDALYNRCIKADLSFKMLLSEEMLLDDFHVDQIQLNSEMEVKYKLEDVKAISQETHNSTDDDLETVDFAAELNNITDDDFSESTDTIPQAHKEYGIYIRDNTTESDGIDTDFGNEDLFEEDIPVKSGSGNFKNATKDISTRGYSKTPALSRCKRKTFGRRKSCKVEEKFICPDCDEEFDEEQPYCFHLKEKHKHKGTWLASICMTGGENKKEEDAQRLAKARTYIGGVLKYKCETCGHICGKSSIYHNHTRIHSGEKPYKCVFCGKDFRIYQSILRHIQTVHMLMKNHTCGICQAKFVSTANLREHMNTHTGNRPFVCDSCGKTFRQKASLFLHKKTHQKSYDYHCPVCNKGFHQRTPMEVHLAVHTGERKFVCGLCDKAFRTRNDLLNHSSTHFDDRPYRCSMCDCGFKVKRYLSRHNRLHHQNKAN